MLDSSMGAPATTGLSRAPRFGKLLVEGEVARGPASTVLAARVAGGDGQASATRLAVKGYDLALRVSSPDAARFEHAIDARLARFRRADETGDLPRDRLYRATDLVRGARPSLAAVGSLRGLVAFWAEVAEVLGAAHAKGLAHGHVHPGHALVLDKERPFVTDPAVVLTPQAARLHPESARFLAPEAIDELLADRPACATPQADVYAIAASLLATLGAEVPVTALEALREAKLRPRRPIIAAASIGRPVATRALAEVLAAALSPERDKRQQDGTAFAAELTRILAKKTDSVPVAAPATRPTEPTQLGETR
jgi:hypothetical protein